MKFPDPKAQLAGTLVHCAPDKVVKLYNAAKHPGRKEPAKTVGMKAKQWFIKEATTKQGWSGVKFTNAYGTSKSAVCVMRVEPPQPPQPPPPKSTVKRSVLVIFADLIEDLEGDDD